MYNKTDKQLFFLISIIILIIAVLDLELILLHNISFESYEFVKRKFPLEHIIVISDDTSLFAYGKYVYEISGPTSNKYYNDDIVGNEDLKVIQKKELPGNIKGFTYWCEYEDVDRIKKRGYVFICDGGSRDFLVVLQIPIENYKSNYRNYDESQIIQTTLIDKSIWTEFWPNERLLIQAEDKRTLNYYDLRGNLLKTIKNNKPFVIEQNEYNNNYFVFNGSTLSKISDKGFEKILDIKQTNNKIDDAFFLKTYFNDDTFKMLYDGQYLHKINIKEIKIEFSLKIENLRQGFAGQYYCIAPFKEGICVINIKEGTYETLLRSDLNYKYVNFYPSGTYLSTLVIFASQHDDIVDLKAWRIGPGKEYIRDVSFSSITRIEGIYSSIFVWDNYLCIITDRGAYFTKYQMRKWRDIWEENQR